MVRAWDSQRGPPLEPWHTVVPAEMTREELDRADWNGWLAAEERVLSAVEEEVTRALPEHDRVPENRYHDASPLNPARFTTNWNRSFVMEPAGRARGVAVLVHGLTDAPFSMRHLAQLYRDEGFVAVAVRLPGHGTVPAGPDGRGMGGLDGGTPASPFARLAAACRRTSAPRRLLERRRACDEVWPRGARRSEVATAGQDRAALAHDRRHELRPVRGARSAAGLLPAFAKAAWLSVVPEFNPFKYNFLSRRAATESHRLTQALQADIRAGRAAASLPALRRS